MFESIRRLPESIPDFLATGGIVVAGCAALYLGAQVTTELWNLCMEKDDISQFFRGSQKIVTATILGLGAIAAALFLINIATPVLSAVSLGSICSIAVITGLCIGFSCMISDSRIAEYRRQTLLKGAAMLGLAAGIHYVYNK